MDYKAFYSFKKSEAKNFFDDNKDEYAIVLSINKENSFSTNRNIDNDEKWIEFKKNIETGTKMLKDAFDYDQVLESFSYFKKSPFYYRSNIDQFLKKNGTFKILRDLMIINQNNEINFTYTPTDKEIEVIENAFIIMHIITSVDSDFATKEFFKLNYIDTFFSNMKYYSDISFYYGLNTISNICFDLLLSNDKTDFVLMKYFDRFAQFIKNFDVINSNRNPKVIDAEFKLIFAFALSIPSSSEIKNRINNLNAKKEFTDILEKKFNSIYKMVQEITYIIFTFLISRNRMPDTLEETYLFKSLYIICDKYPNEICNLLVSQESSPFFIIFDSNNQESIEVSIDFFRLLLKYGKECALRCFKWNSIIFKLSENPQWIHTFISFIRESTDSVESFKFLWENGVYQQLLYNFDNFSYQIRCEVCSIFLQIINHIPPELCVEYLCGAGGDISIFSILFTFLEDDNDDLINAILQGLKLINLKAATVCKIDVIANQYEKYDADIIFQNLPAIFSNDINCILQMFQS